MNLPPGPSPTRARHWLLLVAILTIAAAVRCYHLGANSLWLDEYFSLECSSGWGRTDLRLVDTGQPAPDLISLHNARPWWQIVPSMARDENHPPLFFLMLRGWRTVFGDSPLSLRLTGVIGSLLCIALIYAIGVAIWSPAAALWACSLAAFAWPAIQRAQDARAYPWRNACLLLAVWGLVRIERFGLSRRRWLALAGGALLAPLMHYSAFATMAAMALYVLIGMHGPARRSALLGFAAAAVIYAIAWLPQMVGQRQNMIRATAWLADNPAGHLHVTLYRLAIQPVRLFIEPGSDQRSGAVACAGLVGLFIPLALLRRDRRLLLWWLWIIVPITTELLLDLHYHRASLGDMKYTQAACPGAFLLVGIAGVTIRRWGWVIPAAILLSELLCLPNVYASDRPDWRPLARYIRTHTAPTDPLLLIDHSPTWPAGYWLLGLEYQLGPGRPMYLLSEPPTASQLRQIAAAQPTPPGHLLVVGSDADRVALRVPPPLRVIDAQLFNNLAVVTNLAPTPTSAPFQNSRQPLPSPTFP